ncbi:MAG: Sensors of blue-light using FAD, partial [uncultured Nocardioides sp.]
AQPDLLQHGDGAVQRRRPLRAARGESQEQHRRRHHRDDDLPRRPLRAGAGGAGGGRAGDVRAHRERRPAPRHQPGARGPGRGAGLPRLVDGLRRRRGGGHRGLLHVLQRRAGRQAGAGRHSPLHHAACLQPARVVPSGPPL